MIKQETLTKAQSIATIISAVAIPVVLGVTGYFVQDKIASEGLKRDYVQIAISVLKEKRERDGEDAALRRWAIEVLDKHAPVRFSPDARSVILKGLSFSEQGVLEGKMRPMTVEELRRFFEQVGKEARPREQQPSK